MAIETNRSDEHLYTLPKAADALGVPPYTLRRAANAGLVPVFWLI